LKKITDLSGLLVNGLWGYDQLPGFEDVLPRFKIETVAAIEKNSFFSSKITATTISGSYLECQSHVIEGGKTLDAYPVERFICPAKIIKLPPQQEKALISADLLVRHSPKIEPGDALLISCGWGEMWNRPGYVLRCPNLKRDALEWVLDHQINIFGVDIPCIEASWSDDDAASKGSLLKTLFERDILLLAPLVHLEMTRSNSGTLLCLPINLQGTSGAPCRALFLED
jgi:kynurenine formamidase